MAALAVIGAVVVTATANHARAQAAGAPSAAKEKKVKDQGEYDIYNEVLKDVNPQGPNFKKALTDLDTWKQKYPDSDFKDDRLAYYVQAYGGTAQPGKALETAAELMAKDLKNLLTPAQVLQILYLATVNGAALTESATPPSPQQLDTAARAARELMEYEKEYFAPAKKPAGVSDNDWAQGLKQVDDAAKSALMTLALYPGNAAMRKSPKDCAAAEPAYAKALQDYPDSAAIAYALGSAQICLYRTVPEKASPALYEIARAAALDPAKGADPKIQQAANDYLTKVYTQYHGGDDEGLKKLKEEAIKSPFPPTGFHIESTSERAKREQEEFAKSNPQLALWLGIKGQLADAGGEQYFQGSLKDADVAGQGTAKALKGVVLEGKPACRSKELVVAISDATHPEATLKLDAALTGKPEAGVPIEWNGVPTAFTKEPFMLIMDVEKAKIDGLKTSPCTAAPAHPPAKKGVPSKKKK